MAEKVSKDINLLIGVVDQHIEQEFNQFLGHIGCNAVTRKQVGYGFDNVMRAKGMEWRALYETSLMKDFNPGHNQHCLICYAGVTPAQFKEIIRCRLDD
ncbi:hypothetical protein LL252_00880 [Alcanivorax marinus]|jgi:hypothetical protein|uniref:Uncharacterized protein n=1 Tax=Alloalcanivorax marinus TaxID=1177169 RepID=A0A9Q3YMR0_9GAMM|nr:hypothetical protein [Alloalcanivorax marinus]MCC4307110.1 hypothetical protein [Alloalcanivorax marinus]|tara:strand:- start:10072 stop:10368 length:297 start_codon:yes stop_codon:yes gene_type:complete